MYVVVLKCNCTVSRKECNKREFCIVYIPVIIYVNSIICIISMPCTVFCFFLFSNYFVFYFYKLVTNKILIPHAERIL